MNVGKRSILDTFWLCADEKADELYCAPAWTREDIDSGVLASNKKHVAALSDIAPEWVEAFMAAPHLYREVKNINSIAAQFVAEVERQGGDVNQPIVKMMKVIADSTQIALAGADNGYVNAARQLQFGR